jgi:hypothetical protein
LQLAWVLPLVLVLVLSAPDHTDAQTTAADDLAALQALNASINNPPAAGTAAAMPTWTGTNFCSGGQACWFVFWQQAAPTGDQPPCECAAHQLSPSCPQAGGALSATALEECGPCGCLVCAWLARSLQA